MLISPRKWVLRILGLPRARTPSEVHISPNARLDSVLFEGAAWVGEGAAISGRVRVGRFTTIGRECMIWGRRDADALDIGRFCQFGPRVAVYVSNHRTDLLTSYIGKLLFSGDLKQLTRVSPVRIGHDVWIGHGALILPGVCIGSGATIGAGAVVTKDVRPYSVVAGNPAREIRRRFDDEMVDALLAWKWWDMSPTELDACKELFTISLLEDRSRFLRELAARFPDAPLGLYMTLRETREC